MKNPIFALVFLACLYTQGHSKATFDTTQIHKTYLDGDFESAIEMIEDALNYGGPFSHQDSIFIFKHLGVMHAAKYETREKGKHYMHELLMVEPTAKIMDMYASDMIYMIFKNIQDEYDARHGRLARPKPIEGGPLQGEGDGKNAKSYAWVGWTAGVVAATGGIALSVHLLEKEEPKKVREILTDD